MRSLEIGVVSDEISRTLSESLKLCREWSLSRIELREGSEARFPRFTEDEIRLVDEALSDGFEVTAVSPGIFKCNADDDSTIRREIEETLPRTIEMALRFKCPLIITFGFERYKSESAGNRVRAMKALEKAAELAWAEGLTVAVENEPDFWVDDAAEEARMFGEIGHPALKANWDPANSHWGGKLPTREGFDALKAHIVNVHVKDFTPKDPDVPWRPVGQGETPWQDYLTWVSDETDVEHITIETHAPPLIENTRDSLTALRRMLSGSEEE
jgi:sugar phosphate isomerase/epimerase